MYAQMKLFSLIILTSLELVSSQHQLSMCVTNEVLFRCSTDGFIRKVDEFLALQIIKNDSKEELILATLDSTGDAASVSEPLRACADYTASGWLNRTGSGSWLMLTLAEFAVSEGEVYFCKISYMDHPADVTLSTWNSDELSINSTTVSEKKVSVPGFSLKFDTRVKVQSETFDIDASAVSPFMAGAASEKSPFTCQDNYYNGISCSPQLLETTHKSDVQEVTCKHQPSVWICQVDNSTSRMKLEGCRISNDNTNTVPSSSTSYHENMTLQMIIIILAIALFVLFCVCILLCICFLFCIKKTRHQKGAHKYNKSATSEDLNTNRKTKREQMENYANRLSEMCCCRIRFNPDQKATEHDTKNTHQDSLKGEQKEICADERSELMEVSSTVSPVKGTSENGMKTTDQDSGAENSSNVTAHLKAENVDIDLH